jgi:predicted metal-binding protein
VPSKEPYDHLAQEAVDYGATRAVLIRAADVYVDLRAKIKCYVPICRRLGTNLCCPPFSPSAQEILALRDSYDYALLIQCEGKPEEFIYESCQQGLQLRYYLMLNNIVGAIESSAQKEGHYWALGFGGGHCKLCGYGLDPKIKCAGVVAGRPLWNRCRYPLRARPAMESVGIDVFRTAQKAGLSVSFYGITSPVRKAQTPSTFGLVFIN